MNSPRDLDDDLTDALRRRADSQFDHLSAAPLAFDDVRGRATSIRRRRRVATGLAVAAAVAVVVPTAILATNGPQADGPPIATQTPSTSPSSSSPATPSATASTGPKPHALDVSDLPTGAAPAIGVLDTRAEPALAAAETGEASVRQLTDGVVVEAGGQRFGPYPSSSGLARNASGTTVAWATDDGDVMAWADGGVEPATFAHLDLLGVQVAAVTGDSCFGDRLTDCRVWVSGYDQAHDASASLTVAPGGATAAVGAGIIKVKDADDLGRVLGATEIGDGTSCSTAVQEATTLLSSCDYTFDRFSPTGDYVLASEPYHSGIGSGTIAVFATVGDRLAHRVNSGQVPTFYNDAVWEDDTHVLFTAFQDGQWSIVRMDVQGAMEYAVPPQPGNQDEVPWRFETR